MTLEEIKMATPNDIWEGFVGEQSTKEFMEYRPNQTPEAATMAYTNNPSWRRDMDVESDVEAAAIAHQLARHIRANI